MAAIALAGLAVSIAGSLMSASSASGTADRQAALYMEKAEGEQKSAQYEIDVLNKMVDFELETLDIDTSLKLIKERRSGALRSGALSAALGKSGVAMAGSAVESMADVGAVNALNREIIKVNDTIHRKSLLYNRDLKTAGILLQRQLNTEFLESQAHEIASGGADVSGQYMFQAFGSALKYGAENADSFKTGSSKEATLFR